MRKKLSVLIIFLTGIILPSFSALEKDKIRLLFFEASYQKEQFDEFMFFKTELESSTEYQYQAYYAGLVALQARYEKNIFYKLKYVSESLSLFNELVEAHPEDVELRFLRFSLLHYLPEIWGLNKKLQEDKNTLLNNIVKIKELHLGSHLERSLWLFLGETDRFSAVELQKLKDFLNI